MNNVIAMSVWGTNPRYVYGARRQIELIKKFLPEWNIIIYTDNSSNFTAAQAEIIQIDDQSHGAFWRFFPLFERDKDVVLVRDADSRFTLREIKCINEWMTSDYSFHMFKDHDAHYEFPILAGTFGYKGTLDLSLLNIMKLYMNQHKFYLSDQFFLRDYVYPIVKRNMLVHSMYEPGWFSESRSKLKNIYDFCGNGYDENDMPLYGPTLADNKPPINEQFRFGEGEYY